MTLMQTLTLHSKSSKQEIRLSTQLLDLLPDLTTEAEPEPQADRPLPLGQVLTNIDALHASCNGFHACGLPAHLQTYDLYDYLKVLRAATAAGR